MTTLLQQFTGNGLTERVTFIETLQVTPGVTCDTYRFNGDISKDLGIIHIVPGAKTPLQKVLLGTQTIEGHMSGKGKLVITKPDGSQQVYEADDTKHPVVSVNKGELMQWQADSNSHLDAYELCYPPYADGRYENIEE